MENKRGFNNNEERIAYLNQQHDKIIQSQEDNLVLDFDKALDEQKQELFKIKFMGKTFELPSEMPFSFSTFFMRNCMKKVKGKMLMIIPEDKYIEFLNLMFGEEFLNCMNRTKDKRISIKFVFTNIVPEIMKKWGHNIDQSMVDEYQKKIATRG